MKMGYLQIRTHEIIHCDIRANMCGNLTILSELIIVILCKMCIINVLLHRGDHVLKVSMHTQLGRKRLRCLEGYNPTNKLNLRMLFLSVAAECTYPQFSPNPI
jgi:hypothetical protein